jgi:arginine decarboxylase
MLYKRYFVVTGCGISKTSKLTAFDRALADAGISQCNLVQVSSILPTKAELVEPVEIEPGTITHCVLAKCEVNEGEEGSAGVGWAMCENPDGKGYGIVAEDDGLKNEDQVIRSAMAKLDEMARGRGMQITKSDVKVKSLKSVPEGSFGCVVAALIYAPE